jgi:threonine dehydratase
MPPPSTAIFVVGAATYAHELFTAVGDLDTVYVPIGLGSGICGMIGTRDALGRSTSIVGVVAEAANAYGRSFVVGRLVPTNSALTFAEGMAVRAPDATALEVIRRGADRVVEVSDEEIAEAIACREKAEREAWPTAAIIDSQSVKSAEKGGPASIRMAR